MRVLGMGRGRIQTDPIMNLISNSNGYVITSLERQAPYGATNRTRGGESAQAIEATPCHYRFHYLPLRSSLEEHLARLMSFKHISIFTKRS